MDGDLTFDKVVKTYKRYIEPFLAILILLGLIYAGVMMWENRGTQKEIAINCGWVGEDTRCFCQKSDVIAWENKVKGLEINISDLGGWDNVSMDG